MNDLYAVLGVPREASAEEIRAAYYRRLQSPTGDNRLYEVQQAFEVLSDPQRRAVYDASTVAPSAAFVVHEPAQPPAYRHSWNPIDRLTHNLPRGWRIAIDWIVTVAGAIGIVLLIKAYVVNPYRIPSSSMEPTLHCARPGPGCLAHFSDRVLANRFIYHFRDPHRGEIIVFKTPTKNGVDLARQKCGAGGTFVKRLIGLPGETIQEKLVGGKGYIFINGRELDEPYVQSQRRDSMTYGPYTIPKGYYFMMGDNRIQSCDSREWGPVPRRNLIGEVFFVYWPPQRIGFR